MATVVESLARHSGEDATLNEQSPAPVTIPKASLKQIRLFAPVRLTCMASTLESRVGGAIACSAEINEPVATLHPAVFIDTLIA